MSAAAREGDVAPYEAILAHAELELELAGRGELTELAALSGRWDELVAGLGDRPPAGAGPVLAKARLIHERTRVELLRLREALLRDVAGAVQAKRTAAGYAGSAVRPGVAAVDRSA
jgi:hypothetical protein